MVMSMDKKIVMDKKTIFLTVFVLILVSAIFAWRNTPQKQLDRALREMDKAKTERQFNKAAEKADKAIKRGASLWD